MRQPGRIARGLPRQRMANQNTENWVAQILQAVTTQNGEQFSALIRDLNSMIPDEEIENMPESVMNGIINQKMQGTILNKLKGGKENLYKRLLLNFLLYRQLWCTYRWGEIVDKCIYLLDIYIDIYISIPSSSSSWLVAGLYILCTFMNKAAIAADRYCSTNNNNEENIYDTDTGGGGGGGGGGTDTTGGEEDNQYKYIKKVLNAIRPKLGKVRGEEGRHGAYVVLLGQSIKRCLQLGNMQMAAGFLKLCDSRQINFSTAPRGPMVNFRYYLGRLYMQQEQFEQSEAELVWAFSNCPPSKMRVRRNILECLVAARLRLGKLPSAELLKKYQMPHYLDIIIAMRNGNLSLFEKALEQHEGVFIKHGTILCVERVKFIVFRTLMKKMKKWWIECGLASKPNIVPIGVFTAAIKWQSDQLFDDDEMACISANLIRLGYIKGYISWEHMVIVFSNQDPFPSLAPKSSS